MKVVVPSRNLFPRQLVLILLASAIAIPVLAQNGQSASDPQSTPSVAVEQQPSPTVSMTPSSNSPKEGFWGRVNPFARKKWVNDRVDPIKGRLNELDEVNAKNARDIQDVDSRAQAGIGRALSAADAANQTATLAGNRAQNAHATAQGAAAHVNQLDSTVTGLDQYRQADELEVVFQGGQPALSIKARRQLDEFASNLAGRQGYVLEIEGHSPLAGSSGILNSGRLADAVKRYLVTQHEIPVYRLHSVALGNALTADSTETRQVKAVVHIRLMENSLAALEVTSSHSMASSTGAERP
jgi:outer membrane protein OmpA-like peptidoglycan-associated protein